MKFVLLKFFDGAELVDAYVVAADEPYSFPVKIGDKEIAVEAEPVKAT